MHCSTIPARQYKRSLGDLRQYLTQCTGIDLNVVLICALIPVSIDVIRNKYLNALIHLENSLPSVKPMLNRQVKISKSRMGHRFWAHRYISRSRYSCFGVPRNAISTLWNPTPSRIRRRSPSSLLLLVICRPIKSIYRRICTLQAHSDTCRRFSQIATLLLSSKSVRIGMGIYEGLILGVALWF